MPPAVEVWSLNHWTTREVPWTLKVLNCISYAAKVKDMEKVKKRQIEPLGMKTGMSGMKITLDDL